MLSKFHFLRGFCTLALAVFAGFTLALSESEANSKTRMEVVADWFNQGTTVSYKTVQGHYSGRCYLAGPGKTENNAYPACFSFFEMRIGGENGPGFPPHPRKRYVLDGNFSDLSTDNAEDPDIFKQRLTLFRYAMKTAIKNYSPIVDDNNISYRSKNEGSRTPDYQTDIRSYNSYIVTKMVALKNLEDGGVRLKKGDVARACYYFKRFPDDIALSLDGSAEVRAIEKKIAKCQAEAEEKANKCYEQCPLCRTCDAVADQIVRECKLSD
jgi:hypothetical protein